MRPERPLATGDEAGFTLVELLIVVVLIPIIVGAVATAIVVSLRNQTSVANRITDSNSAQIASAFFVRDVQSAAFVTTNGAVTGPVPCGSGDTSSTGLTFRLGLSWGSPTAGGVLVSYWEAPSTGTLYRLYCINGSNVPTAKVVVADGLTTTSLIAPAITPASSLSAAQGGWATTVGLAAIDLSGLQQASTYTFDLLGAPRVSVAGQGGTPAPPPLLLLGSGSPVLNCSGSNGVISVQGTAYIDSSQSGAVSLGNSTLTATQISVNNSTPSSSITSGPHGSANPTPVSGPDIPDPYASLVPPTAPPALPSTYDRSTNTTTYFPGTYSTTLNIASNGTVVFATGTYIFQQGISVSGGANISSAAGGVLFYVSGGSINLTGNGSLTLNPETPAPYAIAPDLVIWQDKSDTNPVYVAGNGGVHSITGVIYAPSAEVGGGGNGNYQAGSIIAAELGCNGNGTVGVG